MGHTLFEKRRGVILVRRDSNKGEGAQHSARAINVQVIDWAGKQSEGLLRTLFIIDRGTELCSRCGSFYKLGLSPHGGNHETDESDHSEGVAFYKLDARIYYCT